MLALTFCVNLLVMWLVLPVQFFVTKKVYHLVRVAYKISQSVNRHFMQLTIVLVNTSAVKAFQSN